MARGLSLPARGAGVVWRLVAALALVAALLAGALGRAPAVAAATFTVSNLSDGGAGSLRQAIAAAEATPEADTITFAPAITEVTLTSGQLTITRDLTIQGSGMGDVTIRPSVAGSFRILALSGGAQLTLRGLTIANGNPVSVGGSEAGGGILNIESRLVLESCVVSGNGSFTGGGIAAISDGGSASVSITNSTISGNGSFTGGGIAATSSGEGSTSVTVSDSTISDNSAGLSIGGGIVASSRGEGSTSVTVSDSTISGNHAAFGGGIAAASDGGSAAVAIANSTVSGNTVARGGGGIGAISDGGSTAVVVTNSTISDNGNFFGGGSDATLDAGGGISILSYGGSMSVTVANSTISGNSTSGDGGGIAAFSGGGSVTATVSNSTLSGNRADAGGGIAAATDQDSKVSVRLAHATLADNTAAVPDLTVRAHHLRIVGAGATITAARADFAHGDSALIGPFVSVASGGTFASDGHNVSQRDLPNAVASDLANTDPLLGPLADNGGPTRTHLPQPGSPAIDRSPAGADCPAADQRGVSRPLGAGCDSGAVEAPCASGFPDVAATDPACTAIAMLVAQGVIQGYATAPPTFGPDDDVQRAQVAAFLVRALGWQGRPTGPRTFDDFDGLVAELRDASLILANACAVPAADATCVARGYGDGTFGPTDPVSHAQAIALLARAFALDPTHAWAPAPPGCAAAGVPAVHAGAVCTYLANAGAIPDAPTTPAGWDAPASRAWVAMVLWQALLAAP